MERTTLRKLAGISLGLGLVGSLGIAGDAQANTNQHATALRAFSASTQACFNYDYTGFYRNSISGSCSSASLTAVAPVIFTPPATATSKTVYFDGHCTGTIQGSVWSLDYNGTLLGWKSVNMTGSPFLTSVYFPTAETSHWGYMHLYTYFPTSPYGSSCRLRGFTVLP